MTQFSFPWSCTATGDGGPNSLSLSMVTATNRLLCNFNPTENGVVYWTTSPYENLLGPSLPDGVNTVRIASGVGFVEGWLYTNDANVDFDINGNPGNASATDIIVLRRSLINQTVRLVRLRGEANAKATLTQTAATWEVPLVELSLDGTGKLVSITDVRALAVSSGTIIKIAEIFDTLDNRFDNIPPVFSALKLIGRGNATVSSFISLQVNTSVPIGSQIIHSADASGTQSETNGTGGGASYTAVETNSTANYFSVFEILMPDYATNAPAKSFLTRSAFFQSVADFKISRSGCWFFRSASPINSLRVVVAAGGGAGTAMTLYGVV